MNLIKPVSQHNDRSSTAAVAPTLAKRFEIPAEPSEEEKRTSRQERLFSLDFLRGLDIFFLTVVTVVLYVVNDRYGLPKMLMDQLGHPDWVGFTAYDMIMPLFIFICGASLPLALPKYLESDGSASFSYWLHVLKRVVMLWILGMIAQGELFSFDLHRISFFNNTLQAIAVGYLVTAIVVRIPSVTVQIAIPFLLAGAYTAFLHFCGDMTPTGNAAVVYEVKFLELFYPHFSWHPVKQIAEWHYTWWTTIPMFGVMGLAGCHATRVLLNPRWSKRKRAIVQLIVGVVLIGLGFALKTFDPCIKHIFTASFTSFAMGVSFILYSVCYTLFNISNHRLGLSVIILFGRHSLLAYMLAETCFRGVLDVLPNSILPGLRPWVTEGQYEVLSVILKCASLVMVLYVWDWYKRGKLAAAKAAKEDFEEKC